MPYQLEFEHQLNYDTREQGISVPVVLSLGQSSVDVVAKLDCGASHCVFERAHGESLEIDVESGYLRSFSTATGYFDAYGHSVTMTVEDYEFDVMVYFARDEGFNRNILGRAGFIDRVLVGLNDYAGKLYLNLISNVIDGE